MERVVVIGSSGSGKTTVAKSIEAALQMSRLELDSVYHQPGWEPLPDDEFIQAVSSFIEAARWVVDGNYTSHAVSEVIWPRADTIVWLDPSKAKVMWRVVTRTLRRVITRETLWNGNKEPWTNLYSTDPYENIIVWAWTRFDGVREKYQSHIEGDVWSHASVYRLKSSRDVDRFLSGLVPSITSPEAS